VTTNLIMIYETNWPNVVQFKRVLVLFGGMGAGLPARFSLLVYATASLTELSSALRPLSRTLSRTTDPVVSCS